MPDDRAIATDLAARYGAAVDAKDPDSVAALFHPDATLDSNRGVHVGHDAIRSWVVGLRDRPRLAGIRHETSDLVVARDGDALLARSGVRGVRDGETVFTGTYADVITQVDGTWGFASRVYRPTG